MVDIGTLVVKLITDAKDYIKGMKTGEKETKKFTAGIKKGGDLMAGFAAGVVAAGITVDKIFEIGKAGAQVLQTGESFDLLLQKVGAAPDLLDQLNAASKDTVSNMQLMSSTSTLLAGAQGELATQLAGATPRLLEIAKAAQKLNPSLGDTTFLYESLATGIKRASPLILDNLGLTIKIGKANEDYAKILGKTVEALTAEEQKIALLNATLQAGNVLINQVGGTTDSATDSFEKMETALKNIADQAKKRFAPFIAQAADAIFILLTASDQINEATKRQQKIILDTSDSYGEYIDQLKNLAVVSKKTFIPAGDAAERYFNRVAKGASDPERHIVALTEAQFENIQLAQGVTDAWLESANASRGLTDEVMAQTDATLISNEAWTNLSNLVSSTLTPDLENFKELQGELVTQAGDLRAEIERLEGLPWHDPAKLEDLQGDLADTEGAIAELESAWNRQTAMMIFNMAQQQLAIDGLTKAEFAALLQLAGPEGLGLIDQTAQDVGTAVSNAINKFSETGSIDAFSLRIGNVQEILSDTSLSSEDVQTGLQGIGTQAELARGPIDKVALALENIPAVVNVMIHVGLTGPGAAGFNIPMGDSGSQLGGPSFTVKQPTTFAEEARGAAGAAGIGGMSQADIQDLARAMGEEVANTLILLPRDD